MCVVSDAGVWFSPNGDPLEALDRYLARALVGQATGLLSAAG